MIQRERPYYVLIVCDQTGIVQELAAIDDAIVHVGGWLGYGRSKANYVRLGYQRELSQPSSHVRYLLVPHLIGPRAKVRIGLARLRRTRVVHGAYGDLVSSVVQVSHQTV